MDDLKLEKANLLRKNIKEIEKAEWFFSKVACITKNRICIAVYYDSDNCGNYHEAHEYFDFSGHENVNEIIRKLLIPYFETKRKEVEEEYKNL